MSYKHYVEGKTPQQKEYIKCIKENKIIICTGPAGTGKTFISSAMGITSLLKEKYSKLIITRPLVQAGENTGFLPGDISNKLAPFIRPIMDEIEYFTDKKQIKAFINNDRIEVLPFAFMRGRNLKDSFIIADEIQNASYTQIKTLLTRFGKDSKLIITGDFTQSDLPKKEQDGLEKWINILKDVKGVGIIKLTEDDIIREKIVKDILIAEKKYSEVDDEQDK